MSDAVDDLDFWGRQLLKKSQLNPLRERMSEFVSDTGPTPDLSELREATSGGTDLSEIVDDEREERV
ncbi:hypothetical protein [Salinigranum salinum]|uniref:hypothetical protein n=1 Tax=Salinigranum salinum TaxID=1364937 RepID=UPI001260BFEB|nr:hypothetical protein [Salinigranum salinum]